jgi:hypothetical protein
VRADRNVAVTQLAGEHLDFLLGRRVFDPQQIGRQVLAEAAVNLADGIGGDGSALETAVVDPLLDGDVRFCFKLEVAFFGVLAVLAVQGRSISIGWVSCPSIRLL